MNNEDLDALQAEVEKLRSLLIERETGLLLWNLFLIEILQAISSFAKRFGIPDKSNHFERFADLAKHRASKCPPKCPPFQVITSPELSSKVADHIAGCVTCASERSKFRT